MWSNTLANGHCRARDIPFIGNTGFTILVPQDSKPFDFFKLYFTNVVIQNIVQETNRYAQQYPSANFGALLIRSIVKIWKPIQGDEMQAFLGLHILMGLMYKSRDWIYWSINAFYSTHVFSQVMSSERLLHFQDNDYPQAKYINNTMH